MRAPYNVAEKCSRTSCHRTRRGAHRAPAFCAEIVFSILVAEKKKAPFYSFRHAYGVTPPSGREAQTVDKKLFSTPKGENSPFRT